MEYSGIQLYSTKGIHIILIFKLLGNILDLVEAEKDDYKGNPSELVDQLFEYERACRSASRRP